MKRRLLIILLTFCLTLTTTSVYAKNDKYSGIAMDMMFEKIGNLNNIEVSYGETDILLNFKLKGEDFQFKLNAILNSMEIESLEYTMYLSEEADIICKAVAADGYISGNIIYKGLSIDKKFDQEFSFIIDKRFAENSAVDEYLDLLKSDSNIKNQIEKNNKLKDEAIDNVYDPAGKISNERGVIANTRTTYSGHVHASAISTSPLPLISGSMAEGWIKYTHTYNQYFTISRLQYNVYYNFPSDGVTVFSGGDPVVYSPAWAPSGVQIIYGTWQVDSSSAVMVAEATATFFIQGFPLILYTDYDHYYI